MNNKFSWQSFISIGLLFSFIIMFISGLILYVAPEGSLSRWIGWDVFNLTKKQWEQQHTIFSYLFILFTIFHIFKINWGLLLSYFVPENLKIKNYKELIIALCITIFVFVGTLVNLNPFKYILQLGNEISDAYAKNIEMPNVSDAEKLSMKDFSEKVLHSDYNKVSALLSQYNFFDLDQEITVKDFCEINDITPNELYKILKGEMLKVSDSGIIDISSISSFEGTMNTIL